MSDRVLYRTFRDAEAFSDDLYAIHKDLYKHLPTISYDEELDDQALFAYCKAHKYYIMVLPYTIDKRVLLERAFANNKLSWIVVGGGVKPFLHDNFVNAAQRHVSQFVDGMVIGELDPIAFLTNTFTYNGESHQHFGIAYVCRIRNNNPDLLLRNINESRGFFVDFAYDAKSISISHHRDSFLLAQKKIGDIVDLGHQEEEIATNEESRSRYIFHDKFIKPVMYGVSEFIYKHSIYDLNTRIDDIVFSDGCSSVLDVACGESVHTIKQAISRKVSLVVGNDISWSQIQISSKALGGDAFRDVGSFVLFTNHDARRMPFADKSFDAVVCKNVLHHMPNRQSVNMLINEMHRVGKRIVIVEIMDPKVESAFGRLRHRYYIDFLRDAGGNFLSKVEFDKLTDLPSKVDGFTMETVRGIYMVAVLDSKERKDD